jgi:lipopolysaccharide biosynthesis glycosyltransferase
MNLNALRKDKSLEKMLLIYESDHALIDYHDQDLINIYAHDEILVLENKYNYQIRSEIAKKIDWEPIVKENDVLHFLGSTKPWYRNCRAHIAEFWWHYADRLHDERLNKIQSTSIYDLIIESKSLEEEGKFEESCGIKDRIIAKLNNDQYFNNRYFNISE